MMYGSQSVLSHGSKGAPGVPPEIMTETRRTPQVLCVLLRPVVAGMVAQHVLIACDSVQTSTMNEQRAV